MPAKDNNTTKYVNHQVSVDLDSTDAFEGPEKLLEVWFAPDKRSLPEGMNPDGLMCIAREKWEEILDLVKCKVLSVVKSPGMDAYLLSESSMFVFPHKLVLKTCGTTTTLIGLPRMLQIIREDANYPTNEQPWRVFYSRKSFMFPEKQIHPHTSWDDEVKYLNDHFDNGSAYLVGNKEADHWYLYTTVPKYPAPNHLPLGGGHDSEDEIKRGFEDENLELLMTELSPSHAQQFFTDRIPGHTEIVKANPVNSTSVLPASATNNSTWVSDDDEDYNSAMASSVTSLTSVSTVATTSSLANDHDPGHLLGQAVAKQSGINGIYPNAIVPHVIDSFGFAPCGYSCNAVFPNSNYYTIHVTPEDQYSYASFESNVPAKQYGLKSCDIVQRVLGIFRPGKFSLVYFKAGGSSKKVGGLIDEDKFVDYKRTNKIVYELDCYDLVFMSFELLK
ncbi:S-adenosylmethionine decarboxylase [Nadsonia fulvescens var. elongata DSM 6958]|uniref:adenosylmethionine decarboxylase n=1 Tax=Nadsonia fulvescens var. elongata DSM 6958 TaxID=857566 RepID=A0A1E3PSI0_9ASCO|nr:S-adenosylmethionine decarboxylase [Nadsonia fulvescens var. elongata DSM 6958]